MCLFLCYSQFWVCQRDDGPSLPRWTSVSPWPLKHWLWGWWWNNHKTKPCKWIRGSIMRLQQLKHYSLRASSGFQSSIDCGNLNFSSLWEARLYRSTSCIDKLLESVLGAIADRQTRFYAQRFVWCGSRFGDSTPMCNASDSLWIPIPIVSAIANPCEITTNCQVRSVSLYSTCLFRLSNMSTRRYKDPNPTQIIFKPGKQTKLGIASGCLRMNAYSTC
jgi:hypothetical protein